MHLSLYQKHLPDMMCISSEHNKTMKVSEFRKLIREEVKKAISLNEEEFAGLEPIRILRPERIKDAYIDIILKGLNDKTIEIPALNPTDYKDFAEYVGEETMGDGNFGNNFYTQMKYFAKLWIKNPFPGQKPVQGFSMSNKELMAKYKNMR